jgi:hypothetical protein
MSAITLEGKLYMTFQDRAFSRERTRYASSRAPLAPDPRQATRDLGRLSAIHRGGAVKDFLSSGASGRLRVEQLPGYAPDLNPQEGI